MSSSRLAIFDIDGTLLDSNTIDWICFLEAFDRTFGLDAADTDWSDYPHHTDRSLTREFLRRAWNQDPDEESIVRHRTTFLSLLRSRMTSLDEIAGARSFVECLRQRDWNVVLASGAWLESARMKLDVARFPSDLALFCCDACDSREEIVQQALAARDMSSTVIFGDGYWDVAVAGNLALPFVGVGSGSAADALRAAGAIEVIADFRDAEMVLRFMERARPPMR